MNRSVAIMACVAGASLTGGVVTLARRPKDEPAMYRQRIVATMCLALAAILAMLAHTLDRIVGH